MRLSPLVLALSVVFAVGCQRASDPAEQSAKLVAERAATAPSPGAMAPTAAPAPVTGGACGGGSCGGGSCGGACGGVACNGAGGCMAEAAVAPAAPVPQDAVWTELRVEGMHCGGCARRIQNALAKVDGVVGSEVDLGRKAVRVAARAGADPAALASPTIDQLGYRVVR